MLDCCPRMPRRRHSSDFSILSSSSSSNIAAILKQALDMIIIMSKEKQEKEEIVREEKEEDVLGGKDHSIIARVGRNIQNEGEENSHGWSLITTHKHKLVVNFMFCERSKNNTAGANKNEYQLRVWHARKIYFVM